MNQEPPENGASDRPVKTVHGPASSGEERRRLRATLCRVAILGLCAVAVGGCGMIPFLTQAFVRKKIKAAYLLEDRVTLVMVDDAQLRLGDSAVANRIADRIADDLRDAKVVSRFVPLQQLNALIVKLGDEYEHTAIDRIGRDLGAEQVVHVNIDSVTMGSDPGMLRPIATVTVKVVDAVAGKRVFPEPRAAEGPRGLSLTMRANYRRTDDEIRGDMKMVVQKLAQQIGRDVAYVFYDHLPRQPGHMNDD